MGMCQCCHKENEVDKPILVNLLTESINSIIIRDIINYNWRKLTYNPNIQKNALDCANKIFNDSNYKMNQSAYMVRWNKNRYKTKIALSTRPNILDDVLFEIFSRYIKY